MWMYSVRLSICIPNFLFRLNDRTMVLLVVLLVLLVVVVVLLVVLLVLLVVLLLLLLLLPGGLMGHGRFIMIEI